MTTTALVPRAPAMEMGSLADPRELGTVLAQSGYFDDARQAAQAVVKVLAGAELGFGPIASMTGVYIVKGRVTLSGNLMAACIKRHPKYNYKIKDLTNQRAEIRFLEREDGKWTEAGVSEFTMDDAKTALLANGDNWKKYPRNMLLWRAMSNGAKFFCPDAFAGAPVYTPDELGMDIDGETGEIVEGDVRPSVPAAAPRAEEPATAGVAEEPTPAAPAPAPERTAADKLADNDVSFPSGDDATRMVTTEEVGALRAYLERIGAPETFWRMGLMGYGITELEALTVGQAHEVMERAKARFGVKA